ncbi:MAG: hypothetical protein OHK0012_12150 [Synechococcales cyanobacterium]
MKNVQNSMIARGLASHQSHEKDNIRYNSIENLKSTEQLGSPIQVMTHYGDGENRRLLKDTSINCLIANITALEG